MPGTAACGVEYCIREVVDGVMQEVIAFSGDAGLRDDATLVAVKIL